MMQLRNIRFALHENSYLRSDVFYAELWEDGHCVIMATMEYILHAILNRGYEVEEISITKDKHGNTTIRVGDK